ncbi:hypothetical protein AB0B70_14400 [Microbispora bryophytorum]
MGENGAGKVFLWTGGAPRGALSQGFRTLGRGSLGPIPWSVLILLVVAAAIALMRADFGRTLVATGDIERAAALSGVRVGRVRIPAFMLSGVAAAIAGILLGGFAGVSGAGDHRAGSHHHRVRRGGSRTAAHQAQGKHLSLPPRKRSKEIS